jgi:putative transposase
VAHHVTQRGTGRQIVFYTRRDRQVYLGLLKENSLKAGLSVLAWCLMPNHVHLIVVPNEKDALAVALRRTHGRYAQYLNARRQRSGHLWQNRFFSCPLDQAHLWAALRYVERNPVRAGLVERAEEHAWSSAQCHLTGRDKLRLVDMGFWADAGGAERWKELLASSEEQWEMRRLEKATYAGKPFGAREFCDHVASLIGKRDEAGSEKRSADGEDRRYAELSVAQQC